MPSNLAAALSARAPLASKAPGGNPWTAMILNHPVSADDQSPRWHGTAAAMPPRKLLHHPEEGGAPRWKAAVAAAAAT